MGNPSVPQVFDRSMNRLAYLDNAISVGYDLPLNALWAASFSLPANDPKNEYCAPFNFVEIYDGEQRVDLFRIVGVDFTRSDTAVTTYECEHCLATLLDDVIFQYDQIGGMGIYTPQVLRYILAQQSTANWVLGECEFQRQFEYNFENSNLLAALLAVPNCFDTEYMWSWDTTVYPWQLSLLPVPTDVTAEIRYGKNLSGINRVIDSTTIANRIYPLGYGEGVNQLTIASVNNGVPYVEDIISQQEYGLKSTILVDTRYEVADNLMAYAQQVLETLKDPYISYTVSAVDLFRLRKDSFGRFMPGQKVRVIDAVDNISLSTTIVNVAKPDLRTAPGDIVVTLSNKERDVASSISDLQNRALINETYAQGATNLLVQNFADNASEDYPATFKVMIPESTVRINKVLLTVDFEPFRGYSKAISSTTIDLTTTDSGGGSTTGQSSSTTKTSSGTSLAAWNMDPGDDSLRNAVHNHGIEPGTLLAVVDYDLNIIGYDGFVASGAHEHGSHNHTVNFSHTHSTPSHSHNITMPSHSHDMEFGIYEGDTASSAEIAVDGTVLPQVTDYNNINIVDYLATDNSGKITRGVWHTITITPNNQSRIVAALFTQLFTNSRGGGDY